MNKVILSLKYLGSPVISGYGSNCLAYTTSPSGPKWFWLSLASFSAPTQADSRASSWGVSPSSGSMSCSCTFFFFWYLPELLLPFQMLGSNVPCSDTLSPNNLGSNGYFLPCFTTEYCTLLYKTLTRFYYHFSLWMYRPLILYGILEQGLHINQIL